jgi:hypothetical protein
MFNLCFFWCSRCPFSLFDWQKMYNASIKNPEKFWAKEGRQRLLWRRDFDQAKRVNMTKGSIQWFAGGQVRGWGRSARSVAARQHACCAHYLSMQPCFPRPWTSHLARQKPTRDLRYCYFLFYFLSLFSFFFSSRRIFSPISFFLIDCS